MKKSKIFLLLIFIITAGLAIAAIWIGWRLSQEKPVTPTEGEAKFGSPCRTGSECYADDDEICEWPKTAFCTCGEGNNKCSCTECWKQPCLDYKDESSGDVCDGTTIVGGIPDANNTCCCNNADTTPVTPDIPITKCINYDDDKPDYGLYNSISNPFPSSDLNFPECPEGYEKNMSENSYTLFEKYYKQCIGNLDDLTLAQKNQKIKNCLISNSGDPFENYKINQGWEIPKNQSGGADTVNFCKFARFTTCNNKVTICKYCKKKATPKNESLKCTGLRAIDPITGNQLKSTYTLQEIKDLFNSIKNSNDPTKKGKIKIEVPFSLENISITSISYTVSSNFNKSFTFKSIQFNSSPATAEMDISSFDPSTFQENQTYYINAKINGQGQTSGAISSGCESTPTEPRKCTNDQPIETNPSSCCTTSFKITSSPTPPSSEEPEFKAEKSSSITCINENTAARVDYKITVSNTSSVTGTIESVEDTYDYRYEKSFVSNINPQPDSWEQNVIKWNNNGKGFVIAGGEKKVFSYTVTIPVSVLGENKDGIFVPFKFTNNVIVKPKDKPPINVSRTVSATCIPTGIFDNALTSFAISLLLLILGLFAYRNQKQIQVFINAIGNIPFVYIPIEILKDSFKDKTLVKKRKFEENVRKKID